MTTFDIFSAISGFKINKNKCEIAGFHAVKVVKLALHGMEFIDLMFNATKIFGVYYICDKD